MIEIDMNLLKKVKIKEFESLLADDEPELWHVNSNEEEDGNGK
jgi:hypothetical protein